MALHAHVQLFPLDFHKALDPQLERILDEHPELDLSKMPLLRRLLLRPSQIAQGPNKPEWLRRAAENARRRP